MPRGLPPSQSCSLVGECSCYRATTVPLSRSRLLARPVHDAAAWVSVTIACVSVWLCGCVPVWLWGCGGGLLLGAAAREVMTLWIALPEDPDDPEEPPPASGGKARQQRGPPGRCAHAPRAGRWAQRIYLRRAASVARSFSDLHVRVCVL